MTSTSDYHSHRLPRLHQRTSAVADGEDNEQNTLNTPHPAAAYLSLVQNSRGDAWATGFDMLRGNLNDIPDESLLSGVRRGVSVKEEYLWMLNKTITYSHISGSRRQHLKVDEVIQAWTPYLNLSFQKVPCGGNIRISFNDNVGSESYLGAIALRRPLHLPTMNLQGIHPTSEGIQDTERATILHEFGHALGFQHEHQSPSRGEHLTWNEEGIYAYFENKGWTRDEIERNVIRPLEPASIFQFSRFDPKSIMMYPIFPSYSQEGLEYPPNVELSDLDKAFAMLHYPRLTPHPSTPEWTLSHALDILGIERPFRDQILQSNDPSEIRHLFTLWKPLQKTPTPGQPKNDIIDCTIGRPCDRMPKAAAPQLSWNVAPVPFVP